MHLTEVVRQFSSCPDGFIVFSPTVTQFTLEGWWWEVGGVDGGGGGGWVCSLSILFWLSVEQLLLGTEF